MLFIPTSLTYSLPSFLSYTYEKYPSILERASWLAGLFDWLVCAYRIGQDGTGAPANECPYCSSFFQVI